MKKNLTLSLLTAIIMLGSCKKDNTTSTTAIQGTYKLKYLTAKTNSTVTGSDGEKTVTTSDYTTINNQGTLVFDQSNLTYTGLTYSIDTQAKYYLYQDNELLDSSSYPFNVTLPSTSAVATYQLVGADSIYFPQGSVSGGAGSGQTLASGGRYSFNGNLLTITQHVSKDTTFEDSGVTFTKNDSGVTSIIIEKQ
jgi:major membrane immunogen (membrane-anchored lipoprotein)